MNHICIKHHNHKFKIKPHLQMSMKRQNSQNFTFYFAFCFAFCFAFHFAFHFTVINGYQRFSRF